MRSESFRAHDKAVQARATDAFRRRRMLRKGLRVSGLACVFVAALVIGTGSWKQRDEVKHARSAAVASGMESSTQSGASKMTDESGGNQSQRSARAELNDEELLAIFPEGSCFIAEVDGRKKLVFHDPAVRAKFFN